MTAKSNAQLATQCGAVAFTPPPMRAVRGFSFTYAQLDYYTAQVRADTTRAIAEQHAIPSSEAELEKAIVLAGAGNAPRLTPDHIAAQIVGEYFHVPSGTCLTLCVLTLRNGFTVTGESACASPENFNAEIGQRVARENARAKIWVLEGYLLRERLAAAKR